MKSNEVLRSEFQAQLSATIHAYNELIDFGTECHTHYMKQSKIYPIEMLDAEQEMAARIQDFTKDQASVYRRRLQDMVSAARPLYLPLQIVLPDTKDLKYVSTNIVTY